MYDLYGVFYHMVYTYLKFPAILAARSFEINVAAVPHFAWVVCETNEYT
jgi:hypothetical protein